jgi:hypothetical protein
MKVRRGGVGRPEGTSRLKKLLVGDDDDLDAAVLGHAVFGAVARNGVDHAVTGEAEFLFGNALLGKIVQYGLCAIARQIPVVFVLVLRALDRLRVGVAFNSDLGVGVLALDVACDAIEALLGLSR